MPVPYLGNPVRCEAVLRSFDFSFRKRFGQNFLIDEDVLEGIVEASGVTGDDVVLEIGPGIGSLTQYLASTARKVVAVEIDKSLMPILEHTLDGWDNVRVLNQDILKTDIAAIAEEENGGKPLKVIANLPYYITTPIIMKLFESGCPIDSVTVMVQKEVADRIKSEPGSKEYGAISLAVQYYAKASAAIEVGPESFVPPPKVSSTVLHLERYPETRVKVDDEEQMFKIIRGVFNQRRKTLVNAVANFEGLAFSKDDIRRALSEMGLPETARGETFSLEQFAELSNRLK
ncbi:MAG: 16S rRNA (adenine(1518)-N(6)/adenine(1519)-N(6))-dimethyltransferase RsmA [Lachnospiraceae bacterium]|nr:16S rRNA (adenine(1518)-N(6)/adenine(1519)-N(6))-dimethyltransferase RsmA [Lachnospiraceae bacterium]